MEVKIFRLTTGEDVIAQKQHQSGELTEIKKAFVIIPTQAAPGKPVQLMLTPYLPYAKDEVITLKRDHIIAEVWHYNIELDRYTAAPLSTSSSAISCVGPESRPRASSSRSTSSITAIGAESP